MRLREPPISAEECRKYRRGPGRSWWCDDPLDLQLGLGEVEDESVLAADGFHRYERTL
jgi:hypothetical protein